MHRARAIVAISRDSFQPMFIISSPFSAIIFIPKTKTIADEAYTTAKNKSPRRASALFVLYRFPIPSIYGHSFVQLYPFSKSGQGSHSR